MFKAILIVFFLLSLFLVSGCQSEDKVTSESVETINVVYPNRAESSENEVVFTFSGNEGDTVELRVGDSNEK